MTTFAYASTCGLPSWTPNLVDRASGVHLLPGAQDLPRRPGPITSVALVGEGPGVLDGHTNPVWEFRDAAGALVGTVLAVRVWVWGTTPGRRTADDAGRRGWSPWPIGPTATQEDDGPVA